MPTTTRAMEKASADGKAGDKHKIPDESPPAKARKTGSPDGKERKKDTPQEGKGPGRSRQGRAKDGKSAVKPNGRDADLPSNLLEKGIIYFFFRARVGVMDPQDMKDIARSYIILRPIEKEAKLGHGPIGDAGNSRLCAIPKKVLPRSGRDRWIAWVEKSGASFATLRDTFLDSSEYTTKTAGERKTPPATPIGEGIYAITSTGRESHLAYMLTLPTELGDVQRGIGLKKEGSFIISTRNPQYPAPKYAQLPQGPEYPKEILDDFRGLRWIATVPKHLDFANTQFLLVGESSGLKKATRPEDEDQSAADKEEPIEEMEKLESEDLDRMKHLSENEFTAVLADLGVSAKDYPRLQTTFHM